MFFERPVMSTNGILPAEGARSSAVSQFIHPVTDTVSTPGLPKVYTTSLMRAKLSAARSRRGIVARTSYTLAALTIVFWIFFAGPALAQNDVGSIVGFVTDS